MLAYITLRLRITSVMVTTARYVETTIIHGIKKIVKKNSTLDNNIYIATSASVKAMVETYISLFTLFTV